jgi:hypothetical protein
MISGLPSAAISNLYEKLVSDPYSPALNHYISKVLFWTGKVIAAK